MDKKTLNIVLAVVLIVGFFLPYVSVMGFNLSGFNVVFGKGGLTGLSKGNFLFITLLVPLGAILVLAGTLGLDRSLNAGYIFWMPLIGILYLAVRMYLEMSKGATGAGGSLGVGDFLSVMGYGFWITLAASVGLLVNKSRSE
ncbi:MAG TPA: hypothetical protein VN451_03610 [Chitinophagaceae bacterium]|nr:hypothetical protein [Chitinophagaceae bacterium]